MDVNAENVGGHSVRSSGGCGDVARSAGEQRDDDILDMMVYEQHDDEHDDAHTVMRMMMMNS